MYPSLFGVEFLDMFYILVIVGIFAAVLLFKFLCAKFKIADKPYNFYSTVALISIAVGLVCAFLFQQMYNYIDYLVNKKPFKWEGITFFGGLIGGAATFILLTLFKGSREVKNEFWTIANLAAPCIVLGHMFGRFGCFCAGCCYGTESEHGIHFHTHGVRAPKVIPTNLYEALFLLALFGVLMLLLFKFKKQNILLIIYGFAYAVFRFIIEYYRGDERGTFIPGLSPSQFQSIVLLAVVAALAVYVLYFKKRPFYKEIPVVSAPEQTENADETAETENEK